MDQFVSFFLVFSVCIVCLERSVNGSLIASSQTSFLQNTATTAATSSYYTISYVTNSATSSSTSLTLPTASSSSSISSSSSMFSSSSSISSSSSMLSPSTVLSTSHMSSSSSSISSSSLSSSSSSRSYSLIMLLSSSFAKYSSSTIANQIVDSKIVTSDISVKATVSTNPIFSSIYPTNITVTTPRIPPQRVETRTLVILIVVAVFSVFLCYLAAFGIHGQKRSFNLETNKKKNHNEFDRLTSVGVPSHYGINVTDNPIKITEKVKRKDETDYKDSGSAFDNIALDKKDGL
ncbi:uncharacterized protein LOC124807928 [Hydra vulgaris]|uniref:uncharacterized protein LOC124807928 n=1 Tax=Hydra vulgaris TaxID=6087 RepID=UPI0001927048|nr:cell wall integrity and stress response component 1-like [Hydra vulgaris]